MSKAKTTLKRLSAIILISIVIFLVGSAKVLEPFGVCFCLFIVVFIWHLIKPQTAFEITEEEDE